jgi:hypothetical protein
VRRYSAKSRARLVETPAISTSSATSREYSARQARASGDGLTAGGCDPRSHSCASEQCDAEQRAVFHFDGAQRRGGGVHLQAIQSVPGERGT